MTKLKIKFVIDVEYEPDPKFYPEGNRSPEGMLEIDLAAAIEDPFMMLGGDTDSWTITGEIINV